MQWSKVWIKDVLNSRMSSVQRKTSDVFRAGFITVDGTLDSNNPQLYFRPLQYPYQPTSGYYYSISPAQQSDPTLRLNQWNANGTLKDYGYFYDTQFNPLPPGPNLLLAGGDASAVLVFTQDNGTSWSRSANGSTLFNNCIAIAYNGYIWAAGGDSTSSTKLAYSSDGTNWNSSTSANNLFGSDGSCYAIATNGKLWVAGGISPTNLNMVLYSYDGINWYPSASGSLLLSESCLAVAWNGTMWIAGGSGSYRIIFSYDGITWLGSNANSILTASCKALAWNGTLWLAGGTGTYKMGFSYDGINWTALLLPFNATGSNSCNTIAWSGSLWVAGGTEAAYNTLIYSTDGLTWNNATNDSQLFRICNSVVWTGRKWIAGGYQSTYPFLTSTDGITWSPLYSANAYLWNVNAIANNTVLPTVAPSDPIVPTNPIVLMGGETSVIARSTDGITWTPIVSADDAFPNGTCYALTWDGSIWVAGLTGTTSRLGYSYDGLSWSRSSTGSALLTTACYTVADGSGIWLAGGGGGSYRIIRSADGINWDASFPVGATNPNTVFGNNYCNAIAYNGFQWIATSDSTANRVAQSSNGLSWTGCPTANSIFTSTCNGVAWNGQIWLAVGNTGRIAYSRDGITWTSVTTGITNNYWNSVAWNGNLWVVGGDSTGTSEPLAYSYDGLNWTKSLNGKLVFTNECTSVAWTGTMWVATGSGPLTTSAYSYNGIAWNISYNSVEAVNYSYTIGVNRPLPNLGTAVPPPTLITNAAIKREGPAVFNPLSTDLYPSSTLYISDISGSIGINCIPSRHEDDAQRGINQTPTLDISGQLTFIRAGGRNTFGGINEWPELVLSNESQDNLGRQYAGRITMQKDQQNEAWSIDAMENGGPGPGLLLQFNHWTRGPHSNVAMTLDESGNVGIGCVPSFPTEFLLDVCGNANIRNNLTVLGDISGNYARITDISANSISLQNLYIRDISGVNTITTDGCIASQLDLVLRGSGLRRIDLADAGSPPYHDWAYDFPVPTPFADGYKTYLVTVNCVFDASNANANTISFVSVAGLPPTSIKYFLAGPTGQLRNYYPVSFTFIVNPDGSAISVSANTDTKPTGGDRCEFINRDSDGNLLTYVEITGLA
jgi:hypothetical protein